MPRLPPLQEEVAEATQQVLQEAQRHPGPQHQAELQGLARSSISPSTLRMGPSRTD